MFCKQKARRSFTIRVKDLKYGPIEQDYILKMIFCCLTWNGVNLKGVEILKPLSMITWM
jgi:hypothetical protein